MLYTKFEVIRPVVLEKIVLGFYHIMGMATILVMWPGQKKILTFFSQLLGAAYEIWIKLAQ